MAKPNKGLGRGLDALLSGSGASKPGDALRELKVEQLRPGKYQPRSRMDRGLINGVGSIHQGTGSNAADFGKGIA